MATPPPPREFPAVMVMHMLMEMAPLQEFVVVMQGHASFPYRGEKDKCAHNQSLTSHEI